MAYLYGDSSPFPLNENFIDTLRGATKVCAVLLKVDESIEELHEHIMVDQKRTENNYAIIKQVLSDLNNMLESYFVNESPFIKQLTTRLMQNIKSTIESGQRELDNDLDSNIKTLQVQIQKKKNLAKQELEKFLLQHELLNTQWSISWRGGLGDSLGAAKATAVTSSGFESSFDLDLGANPLWMNPVKVSEFKPQVLINLPKKGRWGDSNSTKMQKMDLAKLFLTDIHATPKHAAFYLRRNYRPSSTGYEVKIDLEKKTSVEIQPIEEESNSRPSMTLPRDETSVMLDLWQEISTRFWPLIKKRLRLTEAKLKGEPVDEVKTPAHIARLIIETVAPFVQVIVEKSPVKGELTLKREVKDGHREELFIAVSEVQDIYKDLKPDRRAYFDEFKLEDPIQPHLLEPEPLSPPESNMDMVPITEEEMVSSPDLEPEDSTDPRILYNRSNKVEIEIDDEDIHEALSEETPTFDASLLKDLTDSNIE